MSAFLAQYGALDHLIETFTRGFAVHVSSSVQSKLAYTRLVMIVVAAVITRAGSWEIKLWDEELKAHRGRESDSLTRVVEQPQAQRLGKFGMRCGP